MTVDDFPRWEDGTDTCYELVEGFVSAIAPPAPRHGTLVLRLGVQSTLYCVPGLPAPQLAGLALFTPITTTPYTLPISP
jgi:Uma2 family endonuclease